MFVYVEDEVTSVICTLARVSYRDAAAAVERGIAEAERVFPEVEAKYDRKVDSLVIQGPREYVMAFWDIVWAKVKEAVLPTAA